MSSADLTVLRVIEETTIGVTPDNSTKAAGTLTGTANFANGETVTIDGKVYTFQTVLTNVDGNVKIAATLQLSLVNLKNAINGSGGLKGTDYAAATTAHPTVTAPSSTATTVVVNAIFGGTTANAIATTETCANASWGGATLAGGVNSSTTAFKTLRFTGESLNFNIQNTKTSEITPTRVETDLIQTGASGGGAINGEMSYDTYKDFLGAVFCNNWTGATPDVLTNGILRRSFTVQKEFQDMTPHSFHMYQGTCVESIDLAMEIEKIVTCSFNLVSFGIDPVTGIRTYQVDGATTAAATTTTPMNAITNLQDFTIDGVPYSGCISSLKMQIKNNLRSRKCIGSLRPKDVKLGTIEVTGDLEFYFNEVSNFARFVQGKAFSLAFGLVDNASNRYDFSLPVNKFETGEVVAGGRNTDVMFSAKFRGLYDAVTGNVIKLTATAGS